MAIPLPPGFSAPPVMNRTPMRPDRGEARGRDGQILTRNNRTNDVADQFDVPVHMRERGWDLQWVRQTCYGKDDPQNVQNHYENGWRPVPSSRWPGYFHPKEYAGPVNREGLMLMERPMTLTTQAVNDGIDAAKRQRRNQSASFQGIDKMLDETHGRDAGFEAADANTDSKGKARPMLRRGVEKAPLSSYPARTLAVGNED